MKPKYRLNIPDGTKLSEWKNLLLGDCFDERTERAVGDELLLSVTQSEGIIRQDNSDKRNISSTDKSNYKVVHVGDIAYNTMRMWQGAEGVSPWNGIVSPAYTVVVPRGNMNSDFFALMFKRTPMLRMFERFSQGLTSDTWNLKYNAFSKLRVCIPSKDEQDAIVFFFKCYDEKISLQQQKVETLEQRKKGLLQKVFSQELRFKADDGSDFPEWETRQLSDLFPFIRNGFVGTITNDFASEDDGIRYLEGVNIHNGHISDDVKIYVTKKFHSLHLRSQLCPSDIVMVQSGHVGECAVVGEQYSGSNCHALIVLSNAGECSSQFYVDYFYSPQGKKGISLITTGNTIKHILASEMEKYAVPVPAIPEQQKIADFFSAIDEQIDVERQRLEVMRTIKKGLLQQMFCDASGEA